MSKNLSNQVQKESTQLPVSGKSKKGSSEICQNAVATIEQQSCGKSVKSFSEMVNSLVSEAIFTTSKYDIFKAIDSYENDLINTFIGLAESQLKDLLISLRKERNEKIEYLKMMNQPLKYDYKKLPSYKFVRAFRDRLTKGSEETEKFAFGYSSTSDGIQENHKHLVSFDTNNTILQYRFTNSLLMLKKREKEEKDAAELAALESMCSDLLAAGVTKEQAITMNKHLNNPKLDACIKYYEKLDEKNTIIEDDDIE